MTTKMQATRSVLLPGVSVRGKLSFLIVLAALSAAPAYAQQAVDATARAQDTRDDDCDGTVEDSKGAAAGSPASCDHAINTKGTGANSGRSMPAAAGVSGTSRLAIKTKGTSAHRGREPGVTDNQATYDSGSNAKAIAGWAGKKGYDYYQARGILRFNSDPYVEDAMRTFDVTLDPDSDGDMLPESGKLLVTCANGAPTEVRFVKRHVGRPTYSNKYSAPINVAMGSVSIGSTGGNDEGGIAVTPSPDLAQLCR